MSRLRHGLWLVIEKLLTFCAQPYLRARLLRLLGAKVGRNVRVYEARFFNLENGFGHLELADDVHLGPGCLLDLTEKVRIGRGAVVSARAVILTHQDVGSQHRAGLLERYPVSRAQVSISEDCFIGSGAVILAGADLGPRTLVAAGAVVVNSVEGNSLVAGVPARVKKNF